MPYVPCNLVDIDRDSEILVKKSFLSVGSNTRVLPWCWTLLGSSGEDIFCFLRRR
jgi:hypothetical protein